LQAGTQLKGFNFMRLGEVDVMDYVLFTPNRKLCPSGKTKKRKVSQGLRFANTFREAGGHGHLQNNHQSVSTICSLSPRFGRVHVLPSPSQVE
jgi:hypothetical protein